MDNGWKVTRGVDLIIEMLVREVGPSASGKDGLSFSAVNDYLAYHRLTEAMHQPVKAA